MEKEIQKNTKTSGCLANEIRWQMITAAGRISKTHQEFKFSQIVNKDTISEQIWQEYSMRWLQKQFQEIMEDKIFAKVKGKYKYTFNKDLILDHAKAIEGLTN